MILIIWLITLLALGISAVKDKERTLKAINYTVKSLKNLTPMLLGMIGLVGLMLAMASPELLKTIFTYKGAMGFVLVASIGSIMTIPAPIAYPLASSLLKVGANVGTVAAFITTLTMVGVVTAPIEASYFGKKFTFLRQLLSFLAAIAIGLIMGAVL